MTSNSEHARSELFLVETLFLYNLLYGLKKQSLRLYSELDVTSNMCTMYLNSDEVPTALYMQMGPACLLSREKRSTVDVNHVMLCVYKRNSTHAQHIPMPSLAVAIAAKQMCCRVA